MKTPDADLRSSRLLPEIGLPKHISESRNQCSKLAMMSEDVAAAAASRLRSSLQGVGARRGARDALLVEAVESPVDGPVAIGLGCGHRRVHRQLLPRRSSRSGRQLQLHHQWRIRQHYFPRSSSQGDSVHP